MNCPTNPTVSILKEKETDSTNNRLAQLCDRENIKEFTTLLVDIPVIATIASVHTDVRRKLEAGADILNVSGAAATASMVAEIRKEYPDVAIIATGGPTNESILETIEAGANAITYTPPSNGELFARTMKKYREINP